MNVENEKCVIVVDENLPLGITANTAAILGITMGMKMPAVVFFFGGGVHSIWSARLPNRMMKGVSCPSFFGITIQSNGKNIIKEAISKVNGKYPASENEIMLSEDALLQLGIKNPKLNMVQNQMLM